MKALIVDKFVKKSLDGLVLGEHPTPAINADEILVKLHAAAFNPADLMIAHGEMKAFSPAKPPFAIGVDGAGTIAEIGADIKNFKLGDKVVFYTGLVHSGTIADYIALKPDAVAPIPKGWDYEQAAAVALALLVAIKTLDYANAKEGETIFIPGAGGAVGAALTSLATKRGLKVLATGSKIDEEYVLSIGAEGFADYKNFDASIWQNQSDISLHSLDDQVFDQCLTVNKHGGRIISLKAMTGTDGMEKQGMKIPSIMKLILPLIFRKFVKKSKHSGQTLTGLACYQDGVALEAAFNEIGKYRPRIAKRFSLDEAFNGIDYFVNSKPRGKVVITM